VRRVDPTSHQGLRIKKILYEEPHNVWFAYYIDLKKEFVKNLVAPFIIWATLVIFVNSEFHYSYQKHLKSSFFLNIGLSILSFHRIYDKDPKKEIRYMIQILKDLET
jgi:hypothetical protein